MSKKHPFDIFFAIISIAILFSVFVNDIKDRIDFVMTGTEPLPYPQPYWPPSRIYTPGITLGMVVRKDQNNPVGSDYVQVYQSAKALSKGKSAYEPGDFSLQDPFWRRPNYPPLVNWAYIPFVNLYYPTGLALHNFLTLGLFFVLSMLIILQTGTLRFSWKILSIYCLLYFYTPLGYSHYEKGQFDFYAAAAHLLPSVIFMGNAGLFYFFTSGLMGAFKWSSVPFLGAFSAFAFIANKSKNRWFNLIPLSVIAISILLFWPQFLEYLPSLRMFEMDAKLPLGLSFWQVMPKTLAKSFQIICLVIFSSLFLVYSKRNSSQNNFANVSVPFGLAMAAQGLCFGSISFEYRVITLLGLVVPLLLWVEKTDVSLKIKMLISISFAVFLAFVFRNFQYLIRPTDVEMTIVFLIASIFWLGMSTVILVRKNINGETEAENIFG